MSLTSFSKIIIIIIIICTAGSGRGKRRFFFKKRPRQAQQPSLSCSSNWLNSPIGEKPLIADRSEAGLGVRSPSPVIYTGSVWPASAATSAPAGGRGKPVQRSPPPCFLQRLAPPKNEGEKKAERFLLFLVILQPRRCFPAPCSPR